MNPAFVLLLLLAASESSLALEGFSSRASMSLSNNVGRKISRRTFCGHVEPITFTQSLLGVPVGGLAGLVGSMLGVGGGVIMASMKKSSN
jgi:hypothetical protein